MHQVVYAYNDILSVFAEMAFCLLLPLFLTLFMCLFIFLSLFYPPRVMNEELTSYEWRFLNERCDPIDSAAKWRPATQRIVTSTDLPLLPSTITLTQTFASHIHTQNTHAHTITNTNTVTVIDTNSRTPADSNLRRPPSATAFYYHTLLQNIHWDKSTENCFSEFKSFWPQWRCFFSEPN